MIKILVVLSAVLFSCDAYKILLVFPVPSKSHHILGEGYVRNLLKAGHHITYITPYPRKTEPNLHVIHVPQTNMEKYIDKLYSVENLLSGDMAFKDMINFFPQFSISSNVTFHNADVQKLTLDPKVTFDVVIAEWMFTDVYAGFAALFNCPLIISASMEPHSILLELIDEAMHPAYNANVMTTEHPPFSFVQRVLNLLTELSFPMFKRSIRSIEESSYKTGLGPAFKARGMIQPELDDLRHNVSIVLGNSHVSAGSSMRLPQNYKPIGGYHIPEDTEPLPENLKKILDNAKHGAIYFSLGSIIKSTTLPEQLKKDIFDIFRKLKHTVIWKFEENFKDLPSNVHIVNWAPQRSILAHPNCKLFITHGGLLSTTEALHYGVPVIGMPVFGDQIMNVNLVVQKGIGLEVKFDADTAQNLAKAIDEATTNPAYAEKAKHLSLVYHDRPVTPGKELVHWVEHVVKTKGAHHLRSPALGIPLYQKLYLDLVLVVLLLILGLVFLVKKLKSFCCKKSVDLNKKFL